MQERIKKFSLKKRRSRTGDRKYIKIDSMIDFLVNGDEIVEANWRITQSISGKIKELWEE